MRNQDQPIEATFEEVAHALFVAKGITRGHWSLGLKLRFAGVNVPWKDDGASTTFIPTGMVGVESLALTPADGPGPMIFDASKPLKKEAAKVATKSSKKKPEPS